MLFGLLGRGVLPILRLKPLTLTLSLSALAGDTLLPGDLLVKEHVVSVPVDHGAGARGRFGSLEVFVREIVPASKSTDANMPCLMYLQGGPGFPSGRPSAPPSGWMKAALSKGFRVFLLDQRGTGRSSPVTAQSLAMMSSPADQAEYLTHFRADSIVRDCEVVREKVCMAKKLTLLGQSFGGFCILSYLSLYPQSIERALLTFGLAPVGRSADEVYAKTYKRMEERNRRFYERYPDDVELVRSIVRSLHEAPQPLPRGGTLTPRRFLQLGLLLGSASGFETLHNLLELARTPPPLTAPGAVPSTKASAAASKDPLRFSAHFLLAVEEAQQQFETNPFFWILHESIYCDGGANVDGARGPSSWAAERLLAAQGAAWDCTTRLTPGSPPVLLTGEHVFSWMADDYAWLRQLKPAAELLAAKADWGPLYDRAVLGQREGPPVAALVSYEDIYVERAFSEETAAMLGGRARLWITNEFQHSGLRDDPSVFERLLAMSKGEVAIPS